MTRKDSKCFEDFMSTNMIVLYISKDSLNIFLHKTLSFEKAGNFPTFLQILFNIINIKVARYIYIPAFDQYASSIEQAG
jgi:hypothetical protein